MRQSIVILEDNAERIAAMDDCLADKFPHFHREFFRTAPDAVEWLSKGLTHVVCLSLDHDLEPLTNDSPDPGTGRQVADFLAGSAPQCPVIIHSTNRIAAEGMEFTLTDSGWMVERVMPYDDRRWIAEAWLPLVRQVIVDAAVEQQRSVLGPSGS